MSLLLFAFEQYRSTSNRIIIDADGSQVWSVAFSRRLVHWLFMDRLLHLVQQGGAWACCGPAQSPPRCTKCNRPPINGQCTNFILIDVALYLPVPIKGLMIVPTQRWMAKLRLPEFIVISVMGNFATKRFLYLLLFVFDFFGSRPCRLHTPRVRSGPMKAQNASQGLSFGDWMMFS